MFSTSVSTLSVADRGLLPRRAVGLGAAAAQNQVQGALQGQSNGQPIHIEAMTLEIRDKDKTATFSGNVKVVQGDTTMRCRTLVVFYGPEEGAGATKAAAPRPPLPPPACRKEETSAGPKRVAT
jgi:lipopolysaccharide export system protein LptA